MATSPERRHAKDAFGRHFCPIELARQKANCEKRYAQVHQLWDSLIFFDGPFVSPLKHVRALKGGLRFVFP